METQNKKQQVDKNKVYTNIETLKDEDYLRQNFNKEELIQRLTENNRKHTNTVLCSATIMMILLIIILHITSP